jgi:hypothetical protein
MAQQYYVTNYGDPYHWIDIIIIKLSDLGCIFMIFRYLVITFVVKQCPVLQKKIHQIFSVIRINLITEEMQDKQVGDY